MDDEQNLESFVYAMVLLIVVAVAMSLVLVMDNIKEKTQWTYVETPTELRAALKACGGSHTVTVEGGWKVRCLEGKK